MTWLLFANKAMCSTHAVPGIIRLLNLMLQRQQILHTCTQNHRCTHAHNNTQLHVKSVNRVYNGVDGIRFMMSINDIRGIDVFLFFRTLFLQLVRSLLLLLSEKSRLSSLECQTSPPTVDCILPKLTSPTLTEGC